jgi:eukaryotic-like serine/threonine-protein kinase
MREEPSSAYDATIMAESAGSQRTRQCPTCGGTFPADYAVCPRDATPLGQPIAAPEDALVGAVLGGSYRITRVLGEGGMARLYQAEHVVLDRRYAVKVIHEHLARRPELLARFEREARAASCIRSPHVVEVVDLQRTADGRPCIVAELLEGEDLQAAIERAGPRAPMSAEQAIPIMRQVCRALAAAHACGVVHRDLKPSNVFLSRDASGATTAKILDFGVAKLDGDRELTSTGAVVGTPAYMAPEQAERAAEAGPLADVYAAGAVLYRLMTGHLPYGHASPTNPLVRLLHEEPLRPRELVPSIPAGIEAVIQRAMARDPRARPQSAVELEAELAAFDATPEPAPSAPSIATADEIVRWARTARPLALALIASSCLAAALYLGALFGSVVAVARPAIALTRSERWLIAFLAASGAAALTVALVRGFRRRWSSTPAVRQLVRAVRSSLLVGLVTLAALDLIVRAVALVRPALSASPRVAAGVLLLAGAAAGLEVWRRRRE